MCAEIHLTAPPDAARKSWLGRARLRRAALVLASSTVLLLSPAPAAATAPPPRCGETLTIDTRLRNDLTCTGDGLIIGADGITVDLRGHTLRGSGTGTGITMAGRRAVKVSNGSIVGFAQGARIDGSQEVTFTHVTMRDGTSLSINFSGGVRFTKGALRSVLNINGDRTTITQSVVSRGGLSFVSSLDPVITGNAITDAQIDLSEVSGAVVTNNALLRSPLLIAITSDSLVQHNSIAGAVNGIVIGDTADHTRIVGNLFARNRVGTLVQTNLLDQLAGTVISGNVYLHNQAAGVLFEVTGAGCATCPQVTTNRFVGNGFEAGRLTDHLGNPVADGLHLAVPAGASILVADNITSHNARYGIFAPPGTVLDGGGNRSAGDPKGCLGVVCSS